MVFYGFCVYECFTEQIQYRTARTGESAALNQLEKQLPKQRAEATLHRQVWDMKGSLGECVNTTQNQERVYNLMGCLQGLEVCGGSLSGSACLSMWDWTWASWLLQPGHRWHCFIPACSKNTHSPETTTTSSHCHTPFTHGMGIQGANSQTSNWNTSQEMKCESQRWVE